MNYAENIIIILCVKYYRERNSFNFLFQPFLNRFLIMKKILLLLIIAIFLTSCQNKYEVYNENNQKVAQLLSIDKDLNTAYIVNYVNAYDKDSFKKIAERIAKFYGIEGYYMSFYRKRDIDTAEKLKMEYAEFPVEYRFTPYEYRNEYINKDNDTVASLLWRDGTEGFLYTTQKYTIGDSCS